MKNPFAQGAGLFVVFYAAMNIRPEKAWELALFELTLFSIFCPVLVALQKDWLRKTIQANMALLCLWIFVLAFAALAARGRAGPADGAFLGPALVYSYAVVITGLIRLVFVQALKIFRKMSEKGV